MTNAGSGDVPEGYQPLRRGGPFLHHFGPLYVKDAGGAPIIGVRIEEQHLNVRGIAHGGMLVTLADSALGIVLSLSQPSPRPMVSVNLSVDFADAARRGLLAAQDEMAESGLRVLAFADGPIADGAEPAERGLTLSGLVGLEDPPRPEVRGAIARCASAGIRVVMITGDHPHTALAIAREIGLVRSARPVVVGGDELHGGGWRWGEAMGSGDPLYLQATTACLAAIVVGQVVNVFLCRHPSRSSLSFRWSENPLVLGGIAVELALILAIVYAPAGNWLFGTAPLGSGAWCFAAPFAAAMGALEEGRKAWVRRRAG